MVKVWVRTESKLRIKIMSAMGEGAVCCKIALEQGLEIVIVNGASAD
jgi:hypothetical protein